jgi:hypothetical protein
MTEQDTQACCAHLVIHYRTEPAEHGTVRGYWACATCQRRTSNPFACIPERAEPAATGGEPNDGRRADAAFPDAYALIGPGYDRAVAPAFTNEARVVNVYTACLALHRALENGRELGRIAAERQAYIDRMTPLWSKSQPPADGLRERVEAVIYDIEGTFEAALATPSPAMRALLDRLRAALAATQPEASDAEVGS